MRISYLPPKARIDSLLSSPSNEGHLSFFHDTTGFSCKIIRGLSHELRLHFESMQNRGEI